MSNLRHCPGCHRDLPLSMFPRRKDHCFHCVFNGPGTDKEDVLNTEKMERNLPKMDEELTYVKHETELKNLLKEYPGGLSTKQIALHLEITRDAAYALCTSLHEENKLGMVKEQRGAGRAQNIYHLPSDAGIAAAIDITKPTPPKPVATVGAMDMAFDKPGLTSNNLIFNGKWDELKNRLIKDGDCGTALKIMVLMEEEATL